MYELPELESNNSPYGFPFNLGKLEELRMKLKDDMDVETQANIMDIMFKDLQRNLMYHREETLRRSGFDEEVGKAFYNLMGKLSIELKKIYDINTMSYAYITKYTTNDLIHNIIEGKSSTYVKSSSFGDISSF